MKWEMSGLTLVGYWLGREFWGRGVATRALARFLGVVTGRPLHARVATNNQGSIRVRAQISPVSMPVS